MRRTDTGSSGGGPGRSWSGLNFRPVLHEVERGVLLASIRLVPDSAKRFQRYGVSIEFGPPYQTQGVTLFQKLRRIVNRRDCVNILLRKKLWISCESEVKLHRFCPLSDG